MKWLAAFILIQADPTCFGIEQERAAFKESFRLRSSLNEHIAGQVHLRIATIKCPTKNNSNTNISHKILLAVKINL